MTRSIEQNKAMHKGFTDIANCLIESGVSLNVIIKNLDIRPTPENIKDVFRAIANAKYGITSTAEMTTLQINETWEELTKSVSEKTGVLVEFPSEARRAFI